MCLFRNHHARQLCHVAVARHPPSGPTQCEHTEPSLTRNIDGRPMSQANRKSTPSIQTSSKFPEKARENRLRRWAVRVGGRLVKSGADKYTLIVKSTGKPYWDVDVNSASMDGLLESDIYPCRAIRANDDVLDPVVNTGDVVYFSKAPFSKAPRRGVTVVLFGRDEFARRCVRDLVGETDKEWIVCTYKLTKRRLVQQREHLSKSSWPKCYAVRIISNSPDVMPPEIDRLSFLEHVVAGGVVENQAAA